MVLGGIFVFITSLVVYILTLSPGLNFWDCGEFIACANKLEVGHAPGAPLYLMIARVFSMFAAPAHIALYINLLSALSSALTVWLLYATSTIVLNKVTTQKNSYGVIVSAMVSALAFAFTDTFWFSAVEAEVYALSLLFTAFTLWAILRWEQESVRGSRHRWLLLIAFTMGLSVGVHLLNLLTVPVVIYWVYIQYSKQKFKHLYGLLMGLFVLFLVQFMIVQNGLFFAGKLELLLVNTFHLPVHSGLILFFTLLFALLVGGIVLSRNKHSLVNFICVAMFLFTLGVSSYTMVIIRANAQTTVNLNDPSQVFSLESFINRKQYGERPLISGAWYGAKTKDIAPTYSYRLDKNRRYSRFEDGSKLLYDVQDVQFMQRMYSSQKYHIGGYCFWSGLEEGQKPTFFHQLEFLFKYQLGHMYFRYFLWNFSGRQNHYQGHGDFLNGNFTTGIPFVDQQFLGSRTYLHTQETSSAARNNYFMIPMFFGLLGFLFLVRKKHWSLLYLLGFLFILTGVAIVFYMNQPPFEPRERDYVFAGSFYAFAVFIGLGVRFLLLSIRRYSPSRLTDVVASMFVILALPGLLLANNYDDHNRSDRTLARDLSLSYLESCEPNAILFTYGDNDTYPLWYLQEVEGVRKDVRVVNLGLLSADWYIYQQAQRLERTQPLRFTVPLHMYRQGEMDYAAVMGRQSAVKPLEQCLKHLADTSNTMAISVKGANKMFFLPPVLRVSNSEDGFLSIGKSYLMKGEIALLDIVASNHHERPIYFAKGTPKSVMLGFDKFTRPYGIVSKLLLNSSPIDVHELYALFTEKINISIPQQSWWDETCMNAIHLCQLQQATMNLAQQLMVDKEFGKAQEILLRFVPITTLPNFKSAPNDIEWIKTLLRANLHQEAIAYFENVSYSTIQDFQFYIYSQQYLGDQMLHYAKEEHDYLKKLYQVANDYSIVEIQHAIAPYVNSF
ncbi:putative membrane protein [Saccharicrinis fermentans DSM 9555 = JCM 21142]|uniref:Putative membrane protein n=2 Tax=Saccharicrinis fermentans TaxID=982 RepID=W7YSE9_9BACT|nr:putative membrane protein [Saccharicrinis fermentans DSM 9555 = JCM 21142]